MATNLEIKARVRELPALAHLVREVAGGPARSVEQRDVFFRSGRRRLKLRTEAEIGGSPGGAGELISYDRPDQAGPKRSDYLISRTDDAAALEAVLADALGVRGVVRKRRLVHLLGQTRIHLDSVEGLGGFLEFEYVVRPGESLGDAESAIRGLGERLGIADVDLVEGAYADLLGI